MTLKKGAFYAGLNWEGISFGEYIGRTAHHFIFLGSGFAYDRGLLNHGVAIEDMGKWHFIEIPPASATTEANALGFLKRVLPE